MRYSGKTFQKILDEVLSLKGGRIVETAMRETYESSAIELRLNDGRVVTIGARQLTTGAGPETELVFEIEGGRDRLDAPGAVGQ